MKPFLCADLINWMATATVLFHSSKMTTNILIYSWQYVIMCWRTMHMHQQMSTWIKSISKRMSGSVQIKTHSTTNKTNRLEYPIKSDQGKAMPAIQFANTFSLTFHQSVTTKSHFYLVFSFFKYYNDAGRQVQLLSKFQCVAITVEHKEIVKQTDGLEQL